ncbi:hypothetical protein K432DRAFT_468114 [Lepidopterella palustris CBS 459.81]|uniref:Major facilitator superfamily (MFS) profile domain-containing protein n=1 Tax=Lepidopterella palustris CBS 459.81 TaxID=1314670 RepID=A0A8E2JKG5_9PEZI|nr:hypothetical protein K432DRAFT_468114 [Lepidopterella palustris CBS 459.81]
MQDIQKAEASAAVDSGEIIGIPATGQYDELVIERINDDTGHHSGLGPDAFKAVAAVLRPRHMDGICSECPMMTPITAPVLVGIPSQFLGWRAIFWFLVIMAGVYLVLFLTFNPETGKNVVGNESISSQVWNISLLN